MSYPIELRYTKEHEWVRVTGDLAEIGITHFAQQQLGDVVYVDLPEPGRAVTAGAPFGSIESVKAVSDLFTPVSGEIVAVNTALKEHPEAVNARPHETWIVKIRPSDPQSVSALLDSAQYEALLGA